MEKHFYALDGHTDVEKEFVLGPVQYVYTGEGVIVYRTRVSRDGTESIVYGWVAGEPFFNQHGLSAQSYISLSGSEQRIYEPFFEKRFEGRVIIYR